MPRLTDAEYCAREQKSRWDFIAKNPSVANPGMYIPVPGPDDPEAQRRFREDGERMGLMVWTIVGTIAGTLIFLSSWGPAALMAGAFGGVIAYAFANQYQGR